LKNAEEIRTYPTAPPTRKKEYKKKGKRPADDPLGAADGLHRDYGAVLRAFVTFCSAPEPFRPIPPTATSSVPAVIYKTGISWPVEGVRFPGGPPRAS